LPARPRGGSQPRKFLAERGILYIATGSQFRAEAGISAESVRRHCPTLAIALATDEPIESALFDTVILVDGPSYSFLDKPRFIATTPFRDTLFLDSDTYCLAPFGEIFDLLEKFDFAAAHAPLRFSATIEPATGQRFFLPLAGVPDSFPEFNSGIMAFRHSDRMFDLFARWEEHYAAALAEPRHFGGDQPSLRKLLYESELRLATLTPEYNFRLWPPNFVNGVVKFLHGRAIEIGGQDNPRAAFTGFGAAINAERGARAYLPGLGVIYNRGGSVLPLADPNRRGRLAYLGVSAEP
jgi:hypothetical protein